MTDDEIKKLFLSAVSKLHTERETLIEDCRFMREILSDTTELEAERARLMEELTAVGLLTQKLFDEEAAGTIVTLPTLKGITICSRSSKRSRTARNGSDSRSKSSTGS